MIPLLHKTTVSFDVLSARPLPPDMTLGDLIADVDHREIAAGRITTEARTICAFDSEKTLRAFGEPLDFEDRRPSKAGLDIVRVEHGDCPRFPADGVFVVDGAVIPYANTFPGLNGYRTHVWTRCSGGVLPKAMSYLVRRAFGSSKMTHSSGLPESFEIGCPRPIGALHQSHVDAMAEPWTSQFHRQARNEGWALARDDRRRWSAEVEDESLIEDSDAVLRNIARRAMLGSDPHRLALLILQAQRMIDAVMWSSRAPLTAAPTAG